MAGIKWQNAPTDAEKLEENKAAKRFEIDAAREHAIAAGFSHDFNGTPDIIQMREQDRANITGLVVQAQMRHTSGDETCVLFRAESDETYKLTPPDVVALGVAAQAHISAKYEQAWALKDQIDKAQSDDELAEVRWPE